MNILLLEDDTVLADIFIDFLSQKYKIAHAYTISMALQLSQEKSFDLYIFDINLPDGNGISFLQELRDFSDFTPTIFITAFDNIKYLKEAFKSGASDFIKKPFELDELFLRIENIKKYKGLEQLLKIDDDISFDTLKHTLHMKNNVISLNKKQSELLNYLYKNRDRVISVDEILQNLWDYDEMPSSDTVRTLIKELRKFITKEHIVNIRGEGYKLE